MAKTVQAVSGTLNEHWRPGNEMRRSKFRTPALICLTGPKEELIPVPAAARRAELTPVV